MVTATLPSARARKIPGMELPRASISVVATPAATMNSAFMTLLAAIVRERIRGSLSAWRMA
ncbi:hypothetical protein D3C83_334210 [compost metagenome]